MGIARTIKSRATQVLASTSTGRRVLFSRIYRSNAWGEKTSRSGSGSRLDSTEQIRDWIPETLSRFGIQSVLDIPCGDRHWSAGLFTTVEYVGVDIVPELIEELSTLSGSRETYLCLDAVSDSLPMCDAVLSRDFFIHLSNDHAMRALQNFRASGAKYLMASTYPGHRNTDQATGGFRAVNLEIAPFHLGAPLDLSADIDSVGGEEYRDKALGLFLL